jgi:hypothetical protein
MMSEEGGEVGMRYEVEGSLEVDEGWGSGIAKKMS